MDTVQRSAQLRTTPRTAEPRPFPGFSPLQAADIWIAGPLALAAFATIVPLAAIGLDPHHDGIMLKPALDVADGQVLFRDTFSQYGPLTTFLHALVLAVSPRLLSLKIVTVAADAFTLGVLYLVWRAILPRSLAFVSAAIFLLLNPLFDTDWTVLPWSSDMAMLFQAIAWLALVQTLVATRPVPWAILLGVAAAAVFWCRQPVGLSLIGTLVVVAAGLPVAGWQGGIGPRSGVVSALAAVGGMAAVSGLVLGYLWANDALAVAPNALRELEAGRNKIKLMTATITKPGVLEGIRVGSDEAVSADRMADILHRMEQASPSRPFTMIGNDALPLACVGNRMNISPFYVTWPGLMSAADEARWSTRFGDVRPFLILQAVSLASRATFLSQHDYKLIGEIPEKKLAFLAPVEVVVTAMQRSGKSPQRFTEQADDRSRRLRSILPKN